MMTPDQQHREERSAMLTAVSHALTATECIQLMAAAAGTWQDFQPGRGAAPADVLDYTTDHDEFLAVTEPFFERWGGHLPQDAGPANGIACHALVLLGRPLTVPAVQDLLERAGIWLDPYVKPELPAGFQHGRQLTAGERDELRHLLQVHMENTRLVRNAVEPVTGALGFSVGQWSAQWRDLKKHIDFLTEQLQKGN